VTGSFDSRGGWHGPYRRGPLFDVALSYDDLDVLAKALWDLAALHKTYPRAHVDRLHALRRYVLSVQVAASGGDHWAAALPASPAEST